MLAVDDVQWLDSSSRRVLSFALRRLTHEPVRLITSCRSGPLVSTSEAADLGLPGERLVVGPVSVGVLQRIVATRLDQILSRPTLTRLHQATGGNPMMCLEMARALQRRGGEPAADEPLPVPADLRVLVTERLRGLSAGTRQLLLVASALAQPSVAAVTDALGDPKESALSMTEALEAGVLELEDQRIRFTHPLIASIPYADLAPEARLRLHERLAATVTEPEEHARHAALGSSGPSAAVATALDIAARHARGRGSIDAAAELAELAMARTPVGDVDDLLRRTVDAAEFLFLLGDTVRARTLLTLGTRRGAARPAAGARPAAAGIDRIRGTGRRHRCGLVRAGDRRGRCRPAAARSLAHATLAETSPSGAAQDLIHAQSALDLLEAMPDSALRPVVQRADKRRAARMPSRSRAGGGDVGARGRAAGPG